MQTLFSMQRVNGGKAILATCLKGLLKFKQNCAKRYLNLLMRSKIPNFKL